MRVTRVSERAAASAGGRGREEEKSECDSGRFRTDEEARAPKKRLQKEAAAFACRRGHDDYCSNSQLAALK